MKALTFDDVLLVPGYSDISSRSQVSTAVTDKNHKITMELPLFTSNMDSVTEHKMANWINSKGGCGILHRFMSIEQNVEEYKKSAKTTFVSIGTTESEYKRFEALYESGARNFCIDVAHGHSESVRKMIIHIKYADNITIMAGNVCTYEGAKFLEDAGADLVKVGVGPGSVCSTRIKTGHGVPQLAAIEECAKAGVSIVADGGIRTPGDIVKALAFGADFVMVGSLLAGTHYTPGEVKYKNHSGKFVSKEQALPYDAVQRKYSEEKPIYPAFKTYRGMASREVAEEKLGGLSEWKTAEGVSVHVPYKNEKATEDIMQDIVGGLRSGLTYSGARTIKELQEKKRYVVVTGSGLAESHPHKK
jgi:IMP dehydrogenase